MLARRSSLAWHESFFTALVGAAREPFPEVGSQMAPKMGPQRKSGPVLISQHRA